MGRGPEHSAPLNVKYQRWQQAFLHFSRSEPLNRTRRALLERIFVNVHSCTAKNQLDMFHFNSKDTATVKLRRLTQSNGNSLEFGGGS